VGLLTFMTAPSAWAAFSWVSVEGDLTLPSGINLSTATSLSLASVEDSMGNAAVDSDSGNIYTDARATIVDASASSATSNLHAESELEATPMPVAWSVASGSATQTRRFQATDSGYKTFTLSYWIVADLSTDWPSEFASGQAVLTLTVMRSDLGGPTYVNQTYTFDKLVKDGDDYQDTITGQLSITRYFGYGNLGSVTLSVQGLANAYTIPSPAALLLAGIGTAIVGWVRGRRWLINEGIV